MSLKYSRSGQHAERARCLRQLDAEGRDLQYQQMERLPRQMTEVTRGE